MSLESQRLLSELEPAIAVELERHLTMADPWQPHDYIPWSQGRDYARLGGTDWSPEDSKLSPIAKAAMITNLLTEDNLPSYHYVVANGTEGRSDAMQEWLHRWTAEENRHSIVMRDYLVVTRGVDPVQLENARMAHMSVGWRRPEEEDSLASMVYTCLQEVATRIAHRNTGKHCGDKLADEMLARIAKDENLHMLFYRNCIAAAIDLEPDHTIRSIYNTIVNFEMPGVAIDGFRRNAVLMAKAGIYDIKQHRDEVIRPMLRHWRVFERSDFGPTGEAARDQLAAYLDQLDGQVARFERQQERLRARAG